MNHLNYLGRHERLQNLILSCYFDALLDTVCLAVNDTSQCVFCLEKANKTSQPHVFEKKTEERNVFKYVAKTWANLGSTRVSFQPNLSVPGLTETKHSNFRLSVGCAIEDVKHVHLQYFYEHSLDEVGGVARQ
jgi:hypothetical protein